MMLLFLPSTPYTLWLSGRLGPAEPASFAKSADSLLPVVRDLLSALGEPSGLGRIAPVSEGRTRLWLLVTVLDLLEPSFGKVVLVLSPEGKSESMNEDSSASESSEWVRGRKRHEESGRRRRCATYGSVRSQAPQQ
jgi:hypothetical protein